MVHIATLPNLSLISGVNTPSSFLHEGNFYDADGKRRLKARDVYGEVDLEGDASFYFYEGEDLICQLDRGLEIQDPTAYESRFLLLDHLGTTRAELQFVADGAAREPTITAQYDYLPYGEEIEPNDVPPLNDFPTEQVKFTGKQRDTESGQDYFGARFYSGSLLRWNSPDQIFADNKIDNPRTWNLYQYCRNTPPNAIDTNGLAVDFAFPYNAGIPAMPPGQWGKVSPATTDQGKNIDRAASILLVGIAASTSIGMLEFVMPGFIAAISNAATAVSNSSAAQDAIQTAMEIVGGGDAPPATSTGAIEGTIEDIIETKPIKEGIYEFFETKTAKYVGQSSDTSGRLKQHLSTGKASSGATVKVTPISGGKTAREVAEQKRIYELTNGVPARRSKTVTNKKDSIGPNRRHLLDEKK